MYVFFELSANNIELAQIQLMLSVIVSPRLKLGDTMDLTSSRRVRRVRRHFVFQSITRIPYVIFNETLTIA